MKDRAYKTKGWEILKRISIGIAAVTFCSTSPAQEGLAKRPNILFIICDDLNDWAHHPPGHPMAKTPHMDRLRKSGIGFSNAHVSVFVCGPSRKCLFSGLHPQTINDYGFAMWKDTPGLQDCTPLPLHLRNNGYNTYGTGKLLHEGAGGDFYTEYGIEPDYGPLSNVPEWKAGALEDIPGAKGWFYESGKPFRYVDAENRDRTPDELSADWAVDILGKTHERPFYLAVGFIRPHTPLYGPKKYFDLYPLKDITLPPYKENDLADCASILRNRWEWGYRKYEALVAVGGEQAWKEWVQAYMACMTFVDDQIGRVLNALDGHSLVPLLINPLSGTWEGPVGSFMGIKDGPCTPHFSLRTHRHRYTLCGNGEEELYDHEGDPNEWINLAGDVECTETKKQLREELIRILQSTTIPENFNPSQLHRASAVQAGTQPRKP